MPHVLDVQISNGVIFRLESSIGQSLCRLEIVNC